MLSMSTVMAVFAMIFFASTIAETSPLLGLFIGWVFIVLTFYLGRRGL
jgi:hypothetical protein